MGLQNEECALLERKTSVSTCTSKHVLMEHLLLSLLPHHAVGLYTRGLWPPLQLVLQGHHDVPIPIKHA